MSARTSTPCPSCLSDELVGIAVNLAGRPTSFRWCANCEWKGWERDGETLPLASVLGMVGGR